MKLCNHDGLSVKIISYTKNPVSTIALAYKQCYSEKFVGDMDVSGDSIESMAKYIKKIISSGHLSGLEHASFTIAIDNCSRALTHQLVRHRHASYSQQSQRYVGATEDTTFVIPPAIASNPTAKKIFEEHMLRTLEVYKQLQDMGAPKEDCRAVLPNATVTKIVATFNLREFSHICSERLCTRAQSEIRTCVANIKKALYETDDEFTYFNDLFGPKCELLGFCPEGTFTCGKVPIRKKETSCN